MGDFIAMFQRKRSAVVTIDKRPVKRQHVLQSQSVEATIAHGQRVVDYMHQEYGKEKAEAILNGMIAEMWPPRRPGLGMGSTVIDVDAYSLDAEGGAHELKVEWGHEGAGVVAALRAGLCRPCAHQQAQGCFEESKEG